jgi:hypothetical protein
MHDKEAIDIMKRCSSEIKDLRAQIEHLTPKAEAYDNMAALIGLLPRHSRGMGEDLARTLDRRIEELKNPPKEAAVAEDGIDV